MYNWTPIQKEDIRWILCDFDDTIAKNTGYPDFIPTTPIDGALQSLKKLDDMGYKIVIFTARPWVDYQNIENWCLEYGFPVRRIICGKPFGKCIVDDKNVAFNGDWKKALVDILYLE